MEPTVYRPWGSFTVLNRAPDYVVKQITVRPQMRLSLQSHNHRCEHWVITSGTGQVELLIQQDYNNRENPNSASVAGSSVPRYEIKNVHPRDHIFVPIKARHRITNTSAVQDLVFIETQLGDILEENDIIRYQDDFGRV